MSTAPGPSGRPDPDDEALFKRQQQYYTAFVRLATAALLVLIAAELTGYSSLTVRVGTMVAIAIAGTGLYVLQAQRRCPSCGKPDGFHLRIMSADRCRYCGAELPRWSGDDEDG